MKKYFTLYLWACLCLVSIARADLALRDVTVIDATGGRPVSGMTVLIHGNRIVSIGRKEAVPIPQGMEIVNGHGKFLIPGLWDMHVHLFSHKKGAPSGGTFFPLLIANGVTSVRDMWTKLEDLPQIQQWRKEFSGGATIPRIEAAGTVVDGPEGVLDGADEVNTPDQARHMVDGLKSGGIDFVKVYWNLGREEYFAIADECRKLNFPFAGHTPFAVSAAEASAAGQRSIEHLTEVSLSCSSKEQELREIDRAGWGAKQELEILSSYDPAKCTALFSQFVKNNTWQDPTLVVFHKVVTPTDILVRDDRLKYIPASTREEWNSFVVLMRDRTPDEIQFGNQSWSANLDLVREMKNAGVRLLTGTDMGTPAVSFVYPGFSLHDELALLVEAGLSPMEALQASTRNAAEFLGMSSTIGTIEEGKVADLILLDANPLEDIRNTQKIYAVILDGKLLSSSILRTMLAHAEVDARRR